VFDNIKNVWLSTFYSVRYNGSRLLVQYTKSDGFHQTTLPDDQLLTTTSELLLMLRWFFWVGKFRRVYILTGFRLFGVDLFYDCVSIEHSFLSPSDESEDGDWPQVNDFDPLEDLDDSDGIESDSGNDSSLDD